MGQKDGLRLAPVSRSSTITASKGIGLGLEADKLNFKLKMQNNKPNMMEI